MCKEGKMKAWTDYPFTELGDIPGLEAPVRECRVLAYDWNKYCLIVIGGQELTVKIGYVYRKPGRCGEVPVIDKWKTKRSDGEYYWKHHKRRVRKIIWSVSDQGEWYDFETRREAVNKMLTLPVGARLYCDGFSQNKSWLRFTLERVDPKPYRMKRRY
jgi:hypothetical protein